MLVAVELCLILLSMGLIFFYVGDFPVDGPLVCNYFSVRSVLITFSYVSFLSTCASVSVKCEFPEVEMLDY